jgi:NAD(P)H dehydrogenase (quinone)
MAVEATVGPVRVLVLDGFDHANSPVVDAARQALEARGHEVTVSRVISDGFEPFMSSAEREAYHTDEPLITDDTRREAAELKAADALLFCYPTVTGTVPAHLKGWLERVLVPGVAFGFSESGRVTRGLTNIRRLGAITTVNEGRIERARRRDGGRRTILQTLRLQCATSCRRTWVPLADGDTRPISRALARW